MHLVVLPQQGSPLLTRELVYTAITRARRGLLLVGDPSLIAEASTRVGAGLSARRTTLAARLARDVVHLTPVQLGDPDADEG